MRALILAAGQGTRLRPITDTVPKCLIPINGKPVVEYQLEALRSIGVKETGIVVGHLKEKVADYAQQYPDIRLIDNPVYATSNILKSLWYGLSGSDSRQDLIVIAGDVVFGSDVMKQLSDDRQAGMTLCVDEKQCGAEEVKVRMADGNKILELGKSLNPEDASGEFLGVMKVSAEVTGLMADKVDAMISSGGEQCYLFDMINSLISESAVPVVPLIIKDQLWEEIDFADDVTRVSEKMRQTEGRHA